MYENGISRVLQRHYKKSQWLTPIGTGVMEMLSLLSPLKVQELLEDCKSIKVKRLFLYMAEKAGHDWLETLNLSKISLGTGKRAIIKNGVYNAKYQITIPNELENIE
jgi:hypothetical protein